MKCTLWITEILLGYTPFQLHRILNILHRRQLPSEHALVTIVWNWWLSKLNFDADGQVHKQHGWFLTCCPNYMH